MQHELAKKQLTVQDLRKIIGASGAAASVIEIASPTVKQRIRFVTGLPQQEPGR